MNLLEKIVKIYSELTLEDFHDGAYIQLANDNSSGFTDYIAKWEHPTLERPTQEQLDAVEE